MLDQNILHWLQPLRARHNRAATMRALCPTISGLLSSAEAKCPLALLCTARHIRLVPGSAWLWAQLWGIPLVWP